jgi:carbonic anhydrase
METELAADREALMARAVRANIRASVNQLRHGSRILEELGEKDGLRIVGAEYDLATGLVTFLDDAGPEA